MVSHSEHSRRSDLAALWADQIKIKEISQGQELTLKDRVHYFIAVDKSDTTFIPSSKGCMN